MAIIKLGALVSDIRGSLQNGVYSVAKGGVHYVKNIPASVMNPNSPDQNTARRAIMTAAKGWYNTLTAAQRAGWETLAQQLGVLESENSNGIKDLVPAIGMKGSGINAFCAFGARSTLAGLYSGFSSDAPLGEVQPTPPLTPVASYDAGILTVTWTAPAISDPAARVALWIRSHQKIYHKQIVSYAELIDLNNNTDTARAALGKYLSYVNAVPFEMSLQLQTVNPSGWASPGTETLQVVCS